MRKFVSSLMAIAFVLALGASQAFAMDKMTGGSMMMKCPAGSHWVKGYMNKKTHKMVKGYCRKKTMMKM